MSKITNGGLTRSQAVCRPMLYSCSHMATVGVKGLSERYACLVTLLCQGTCRPHTAAAWVHMHSALSYRGLSVPCNTGRLADRLTGCVANNPIGNIASIDD